MDKADSRMLTGLLRPLAAAACLLAACWAQGAPTKVCNRTPNTTSLYLSISQEMNAQAIDRIVHALENPGVDAALLEFLGNPLPKFGRHAFGGAYPDMLVLNYDRVQDMHEIVERLVADKSFASGYAAIGVNTSFTCLPLDPGGSPGVRVTEYHNVSLNHYFLASSDIEIEAIARGDAGPDWRQTGQRWMAGGLTGCQAASKAVYRFYGTPGIGPNSHFYTAAPEECGFVRNNDKGWQYEGVAFGAELPVNGACPAAHPKPVYRVYNNRRRENDSNHRYAVDLAIYHEMIAKGWVGEGIVMCARADEAPPF